MDVAAKVSGFIQNLSREVASGFKPVCRTAVLSVAAHPVTSFGLAPLDQYVLGCLKNFSRD
jgi:hypothetical protein